MITQVSLITSSKGKAREFSDMLDIEVTPVEQEVLAEIQPSRADAVAEVVRRKALDAYAILQTPVLTDDTGLALHAWNGLPGALVVYFLESVGVKGILKMAAAETNRSATATCAIGYADADGAQVFTGERSGILTTEPPR